MKKTLLLVKLFVLMAVLSAQAQMDFEGLKMPTHKNGSNGAGGFYSGSAFFVNYYNSDYGSWAGFAVSKETDTETSGWSNQYSAKAGSGADGSDNYMTSYISSYAGATYIKLATAKNITSVEITNSTYAYNSMRDGDAYSKKFGGDDGNDKDTLVLSIIGYKDDVKTDSIDFFLADFRNDDNDYDYIINNWRKVNLSYLGTVDSVVFKLTSSDNGAYGMNTPAYFCMDNLEFDDETIDFENFDFDYWNGEDLTAGFYDAVNGDSIFFHNNFFPSSWGGFWSGFAYSKKTDVTTAGYTNMYSAITGEGFAGSENYLISSNNSGFKLEKAQYLKSIKITNTTYATLSMENGDYFAKKFGGDDGNDQDWFLLTIKGYKNGNYTDSVNFYLADYRFEDNSKDYIVKNWVDVDVFALGEIDSASFYLTSSDNGAYGMNTPGYFAMDNISLSSTFIAPLATNKIQIYPNPASDIVTITSENTKEIVISDLTGKIVYQQKDCTPLENINISNLYKGVYIVLVKTDKQVYTQKLIKE